MLSVYGRRFISQRTGFGQAPQFEQHKGSVCQCQTEFGMAHQPFAARLLSKYVNRLAKQRLGQR
jgi:hypothetical protein